MVPDAPHPRARRYTMYGDNTKDDVMNNLGKTTLLWFTRVFVGVAVLCHYPINQHVARAALDDVVRVLRGEEQTEYMPYWRLCVFTAVVFVVALSFALSVSGWADWMGRPAGRSQSRARRGGRAWHCHEQSWLSLRSA